MCNWKRWIWPGILTVAILTALAMVFQSDKLESALTTRAGAALQNDNPHLWSSASLDGRDLTLSGTAQARPGAQLEIGRHTDSEGSDELNRGLSQERAAAVVAYLAKGGVEMPRLGAKGYGESRSIADNGTDDGKAKNRRIEFRVIQ